MNQEAIIASWKELTLTDFSRFRQAREQVHQALQLVGATARSYLPTIKDESFANLDWLPDQGLFAGRIVGGRWQFRTALRPSDLTLHLLSPQNRPLSHLNLNGKTYQQATEWLKSQFRDFDLDGSLYSTEAPYSIDAYPYASGTPFNTSDLEAFEEIGKYFHNAHLILQYVSHLHLLALPIKVWPHHMDIATRRRFQNPAGQWHMGIAFSPGDIYNYPEPNFHLTRYPKEPANEGPFPDLGEGIHWHNNERWLGMVVKQEDFVKQPGAAAQVEAILKLVHVGMEALAGL